MRSARNGWRGVQIARLQAALSFLTTLPAPAPSPRQLDADPDLYGASFAWYPFVGLLIGALLALAYWALGWTPLSPAVQAGLLLGGWILLTGGLHLDGLMDACDALFAPVDVARRLAILTDVHAGAFGVAGAIWLLGMKWSLLAHLVAQRPDGAAALLLAPLWGRWILVWAAERFPHARSEPGTSLGGTMRRGLARRHLVIASTVALLAQGGLAVGMPSLLWVLLAPLGGIGLARWAARRLGGGLTGDIYGALCETVETIALLCVALC